MLLRCVLSLVVLMGIVGCAPGLGSGLRVVTDAQSGLLATSSETVVPVTFLDSRERKDIGEISGRGLAPIGDVDTSVAFMAEGTINNLARETRIQSCCTVMGEVLNWYVNVSPSFPLSSIKANATVKLHFVERGAKPIYSATYSGEVSQSGLAFSQDYIEGVLMEAMQLALAEPVNDLDLLEVLRR